MFNLFHCFEQIRRHELKIHNASVIARFYVVAIERLTLEPGGMLPGGTPYDMSSSRAHVRFTEYSVQKVDLFPAQNVAVVGDVIFSDDEIDNMDSNIGILGDPTDTPQSTNNPKLWAGRAEKFLPCVRRCVFFFFCTPSSPHTPRNLFQGTMNETNPATEKKEEKNRNQNWSVGFTGPEFTNF
ncbi:uncharacterized protein BO66DRAFT_99774 [Aspergillus aculeatinus CBS 121060]|uniref:Uncharacterized protein n=1 Tax=Aspergillus aculeatinus CBS 121060 TaxID=1448322 RepID=A0ACD1H771_9EURO|nr:hypothetical protein BO66DRAFT_99774 [Aspergillus aculeatinus CBS 121060]RAH69650.1 hypothetical protein BO66DRAFT_99774 [Aspergillus aculeatinus CBS 121060]